jgi:Ras family.
VSDSSCFIIIIIISSSSGTMIMTHLCVWQSCFINHCTCPQAGSIVIAIAATKYDLINDPTTQKSSLVSTSHARELAKSIDAIFVDTSARNDENVNLLFQKVAERVLWVREQAKSRGLLLEGNGGNSSSIVGGGGGGGLDAIPVSPRASMNDHGNVVKGNQEVRRNGMNPNSMTVMTVGGGGGGGVISSAGNTPSSSSAVGLTTTNHRPHPIHSLQRDSPERTTLEKGGNGQISSPGVGRDDVPLDDEQQVGGGTSRSSSVGLCMGPLMECSSSKDEGSCTIC